MLLKTAQKLYTYHIIMVTLVFQAISDLLLLQNVKNVQNGTNFLGTSLKIRFQTLITHKNMKNRGKHNNLVCVIFM